MSAWLPISFIGSAAVNTTFVSPGPTISYTSGSNQQANEIRSLVLVGYIHASASGGLSAVSGVTSITDSSGVNVWQFSAVNSQFPPSVYNSSGNGHVMFVAWCINAQPVNSVTLNDATGHTDTWGVVLTEWSGIAWPDGTVAAQTAPGVTGTDGGTVRVSTPGDLVIGGIFPDGGTLSTAPWGAPPANPVAMPGSPTLSSLALFGQQILISAPPATPIFVGATVQNFTGLTGSGSTATPAFILPGDLLIFDTILSGGGTVSAQPAGFTQQLLVTGANNSANLRYVATKIADGTEGANLAATVTGAANGIFIAYAIRGVQSATPANTATLTAGGFTTSPGSAALTIANSTDVTVYGYGGCTSGNTGTTSVSSTGLTGLSNFTGTIVAGHGVSSGIAWGIDDASPGSATASTAVDELDWAMDFAAIPLGVGGMATWTWLLTGQPGTSVAMASFGPQGVPVAAQPIMQAF